MPDALLGQQRRRSIGGHLVGQTIRTASDLRHAAVIDRKGPVRKDSAAAGERLGEVAADSVECDALCWARAHVVLERVRADHLSSEAALRADKVKSITAVWRLDVQHHLALRVRIGRAVRERDDRRQRTSIGPDEVHPRITTAHSDKTKQNEAGAHFLIITNARTSPPLNRRSSERAHPELPHD
jgi:hypothetical protein